MIGRIVPRPIGSVVEGRFRAHWLSLMLTFVYFALLTALVAAVAMSGNPGSVVIPFGILFASLLTLALSIVVGRHKALRTLRTVIGKTDT